VVTSGLQASQGRDKESRGARCTTAPAGQDRRRAFKTGRLCGLADHALQDDGPPAARPRLTEHARGERGGPSVYAGAGQGGCCSVACRLMIRGLVLVSVFAKACENHS